jgi:hypothetical protein
LSIKSINTVLESMVREALTNAIANGARDELSVLNDYELAGDLADKDADIESWVWCDEELYYDSMEDLIIMVRLVREEFHL